MMRKRAAIFDLDGTLIPNTSAESTFFFHLLKSGGLNVRNVFQMLGAIWTARGNLHDMVRGNKRYLKNKPVEKFESVAHEFFEPRIETMIFPEMKEVIEKHRSEGDLLLLLTGTLDVIAACFVRKLQFDGYEAATLEIRDGHYTGKLNGTLPYGMGKLEVLRNLKDRHNFDRNQTYLYANIFSDRYVLNAVEHPVAVNPDSKLRSYSKRLGWNVIDVTKKTSTLIP
ncbi:HAD-IB family hydrolase [Chitinispirillales bacterium ANBcel5]|uniref:HAD family hydrolase n=1 Tax=Cellulosispirillum alkaliphilum TaxID=3039283 RepID=UPI002A536BDE|nr:HAD-IB family hydrolase [Chitinispirillales bacterium ANBcel5]